MLLRLACCSRLRYQRSVAEPLGRLYFAALALSSWTCSILSDISRLKLPFCASTIRPVALSSVSARSTAPSAMAIIVTDWPEFTELDWRAAAKRMAGRTVIDGRNCVDPEAVEAAGLDYEGIGR